MAKAKEIELAAYDDLFKTEPASEMLATDQIKEIPLDEIDEFPNHPFKVLLNNDMEQLVESIRQNGIMTPAIVRQKENGRYELISGHRRKKACELAELVTLKCEVRDLTYDAAVIAMVESNLQRTVILPSEKAFAYKMRLEAMNRQGKRNDLTLCPVGNKSASEISKEVGDSERQIFRYIRLTELIPELLQMVDEQKLAFRPAVEISYLTEEKQKILIDEIKQSGIYPSLAQATKMKKLMQESKLTIEMIHAIMREGKGVSKNISPIKDKRITRLIPKDIPQGEEADFIVKALEFYIGHLKKEI